MSTLPGPDHRALLRAFPGMIRDPLAGLAGWVERYGDLVAVPAARRPMLLVNDPDAARRLLVARDEVCDKQTVQYQALAEVTGGGLLTSDGQAWARHRRIVRPAFSSAAVEAVAPQAAQAGRALRARWDAAPDRTLDVTEAVPQVLLDLVGRSLFGAELDGSGARGDALADAVEQALRAVILRASPPLPGALARVDPRGAVRLRRARAVLDAACTAVIRTRRATGPPGRADLLGLLLDAADTGAITEAEVRAELITFVIAGHETVAAALTWALHLLSRHPHWQDALAAEVAGRSGGTGPLTRAVLDEALRLYPPAWVITRRLVAAHPLAGIELPAGTTVIVSPWLLHRRAASWPDPLRFDPNRFLPPAPPPRPGSYLPFGTGPRRCIGARLALVEAGALLAELLRGRRVVAVRERVPVNAGVSLRPRGGLPLRLEPRGDG